MKLLYVLLRLMMVQRWCRGIQRVHLLGLEHLLQIENDPSNHLFNKNCLGQGETFEFVKFHSHPWREDYPC